MCTEGYDKSSAQTKMPSCAYWGKKSQSQYSEWLADGLETEYASDKFCGGKRSWYANEGNTNVRCKVSHLTSFAVKLENSFARVKTVVADAPNTIQRNALLVTVILIIVFVVIMLTMVASFIDAYKKKRKLLLGSAFFAIRFISALKLKAKKHSHKLRRKSVFNILYPTIVRSDTYQAYLREYHTTSICSDIWRRSKNIYPPLQIWFNTHSHFNRRELIIITILKILMKAVVIAFVFQIKPTAARSEELESLSWEQVIVVIISVFTNVIF